MFVPGYFLLALATVIDWGLLIFMWIIIARAILSWVSPDPYNPIVRFIYNATEPVLIRIRSIVPTIFGGLDLAPIYIIAAVMFLRIFLVNNLIRIAQMWIQ